MQRKTKESYIYSEEEVGNIFGLADFGNIFGRNIHLKTEFPMLLRLLLGCGLRLGEALSLKVSDMMMKEYENPGFPNVPIT